MATKATARNRLFIALSFGLIAGLSTLLLKQDYLVPLVGWDVAAISFLLLNWPHLWHLNANQTRNHARQEDPSRNTTRIIVLLAATASLGAAAMVLSRTPQSNTEELLLALLTIVSVVLSWIVVHTLYALHYAVIYYETPEGGVGFNQTEDPIYSDFAYLAFTIGMTYQVSDTGLKNRKFRRAALAHALFSFLFGTIIIATTINLVAGLAK